MDPATRVDHDVAGGGLITVTILRTYRVAAPISLDVTIVAGARAIRGPVAGTVVTSGFEGEHPVRTLGDPALHATAVEASGRASTTVTWDGNTDAGNAVEKGTYVVILDFIVGTETTRTGTTLEIALP